MLTSGKTVVTTVALLLAVFGSAVLAGAIAMDGAQSSDPIGAAEKAFQSNVNKFAQSSASQIAASFTVNSLKTAG